MPWFLCNFPIVRLKTGFEKRPKNPWFKIKPTNISQLFALSAQEGSLKTTLVKIFSLNIIFLSCYWSYFFVLEQWNTNLYFLNYALNVRSKNVRRPPELRGGELSPALERLQSVCAFILQLGYLCIKTLSFKFFAILSWKRE